MGMFLNFKERNKLKMFLTVKITRFSSLWTAIVFAGIVLIAVLVFKLNEIMALMACRVTLFRNRKQNLRPKSEVHRFNNQWIYPYD